jgi:hypothetical protein
MTDWMMMKTMTHSCTFLFFLSFFFFFSSKRKKEKKKHTHSHLGVQIKAHIYIRTRCIFHSVAFKRKYEIKMDDGWTKRTKRNSKLIKFRFLHRFLSFSQLKCSIEEICEGQYHLKIDILHLFSLSIIRINPE